MLKAPAEELKKFDALRAAQEKSPEDPKANYDFALALFKRGKAEEGNAALDKVLACDPGDQSGLADDVDLARVEQMLAAKAFADAEAATRAFMDKHAQSDLMAKAYLFLGAAEVNQNKFDEGIAAWKTGIEKYPTAAESKHAQALIAKAEKRKEGLQKKQEPEGK
ncbi:MAG: tetratricopeptide repeat protein [Planctomycetota bacterium]